MSLPPLQDLLDLFPDNTTGEISAQDVRDQVAAWYDEVVLLQTAINSTLLKLGGGTMTGDLGLNGANIVGVNNSGVILGRSYSESGEFFPYVDGGIIADINGNFVIDASCIEIVDARNIVGYDYMDLRLGARGNVIYLPSDSTKRTYQSTATTTRLVTSLGDNLEKTVFSITAGANYDLAVLEFEADLTINNLPANLPSGLVLRLKRNGTTVLTKSYNAEGNFVVNGSSPFIENIIAGDVFTLTLQQPVGLGVAVVIQTDSFLTAHQYGPAIDYAQEITDNAAAIAANAAAIATKEDDLGLPGANGYILSSDILGNRSWIPDNAGGDMQSAVYDPTNIAADAFARANHTGTQLAATISDFQAQVSANTDVSASKAKTDFITITQPVDLDALESDVAGKLDSVVAGTNITIDNTDPNNPIINSTASGGLEDWVILNTATTMVSGGRYQLDYSGGDFDITLPATPTAGDEVWLLHIQGNVEDGTPPAMLGNGSNIDGDPSLDLDVNDFAVHAVYSGVPAIGWRVFNG